jgi:phosphatidylglycerophosphate synthase
MDELQDTSKIGRWPLRRFEDRLRPVLARYVPRFIETYHLTLMTLIWSFGVVASGFLAQYDMRFLWISSLMIVCQYFTDLLDGTIGRLRNTGLVRWGHYMDHFLDYVFFTALILSYTYLLPSHSHMMVIIAALIQIGFMVNIFLAYGATDKLSISFAGIGPTELRILYIAFNIFLMFYGVTWPIILLPYFAILMGIALVINVFITQKKIWAIDMRHKANDAQ